MKNAHEMSGSEMWHAIRDKIVDHYRSGKTHKEAIDLALKETNPNLDEKAKLET